MSEKEAKARIKINKLLEESGWSFFDSDKGKATIKLESSIKIDVLGEDFEHSKNGFINFLLVDENQNPILVLEAKKESLNPLVGKEQARNYAKSQKVNDNSIKAKREGFEYTEDDKITSWNEQKIDYTGMKVDRMFFQQFEEKVKTDGEKKLLMEAGEVEIASARVKEKFDNKPDEYFDLEKLRRSLKIDRKIGWQELLELIYFGNQIKGKDDLLSDEFEKFISTNNVSNINDLQGLRYFFYAYITDPSVRNIIDQQDFTELYHNPSFNVNDFNRVDDTMKSMLTSFVKTYVSINRFAS
jgi:hypothetical protein